MKPNTFARRPRLYFAGWPAALGLALGSFVTDLPGAVTYVTPAGSTAPVVGDAAWPWHTVEGAARALFIYGGGTISLSPGVYRESMSLSNPVVLVAPSGGAMVGDRTTGVAATTTFNVFTWNTHLAGDEVFLPSWRDYERAEEMGNRLGSMRATNDLVSFCEVWDQDLFHGGDGAPGLRPLAGYQHGIHGTRVDQQAEFCALCPAFLCPTVLNSGLAMMSDQSLTAATQVSFDDCDGSCPTSGSPDCLASKGFIAATVSKGDFTLRVYNAHTQAGNSEAQVEARENQLVQMMEHIAAYRNAHPAHVVLLMGDLNVIGETAEQYHFLRDVFGGIGGRDAARNAANTSMYTNQAMGHTLTSSNELARYFDKTPYDQRLDYVWYFPSLDGKIKVHPEQVERILFRAQARTEDDLTSDELSDHYPLEAQFTLYRLR